MFRFAYPAYRRLKIVLVCVQNSNPKSRVSIIEPRINEMGLNMYINVWLQPYLAVDYDVGELGG